MRGAGYKPSITNKVYLAFEQHNVDVRVFVHGRQNVFDCIDGQPEPDQFIRMGGEWGGAEQCCELDACQWNIKRGFRLCVDILKADTESTNCQMNVNLSWRRLGCSPVIFVHRTTDVHDDYHVLRATRSCHIPFSTWEEILLKNINRYIVCAGLFPPPTTTGRSKYFIRHRTTWRLFATNDQRLRSSKHEEA